MTLILTLGNSEQVIQVSDRRLSWNGRLVEDESSKAGLWTCLNARLAFGFTGLARWGNFCTRDWLLDVIWQSGPPDYRVGEVLERLRVRASDTFARHPALRTSSRRDRRLSIMLSGYLYDHDPPLLGCALLTNFQNLQSGQDEVEAWDEFTGVTWSVRLSLDYEPTFIQHVGNWRAMTRDDEVALRDLLKARKPAHATIGKAVELVRQMADRPAAQNTIGKQLSIIRIPRERRGGVESGYYSNVNNYDSYMADGIFMEAPGITAFKDIQLHIVGPLDGSPVVVPKVGRNHPCPCRSGKKYKHCHGKIPSA